MGVHAAHRAATLATAAALVAVLVLVTATAVTSTRTVLTRGVVWAPDRGSASAAPPAGVPTARHSAPLSAVGALFTAGLGQPHSCSASVLAGPDRDLVLSAAHCVHASAAGDLFVPGYSHGASPEGVWMVLKAWVDPAWLTRQDPHDDVVLLQVAPRPLAGHLVHLEDLTGGLPLGSAPAPGTQVTVAGYASGLDDEPLTCTAPTIDVGSYPDFRCSGYLGGTSGSPFLVTGRDERASITGVIGGLQRGGCQDWQSFTSPFDRQVRDLLARADSGAPGDQTPWAGPPHCAA